MRSQCAGAFIVVPASRLLKFSGKAVAVIRATVFAVAPLLSWVTIATAATLPTSSAVAASVALTKAADLDRPQGQRGMTVRDLLKMSAPQSALISPDGTNVLLTVSRARDRGVDFMAPRTLERSEILLLQAKNPPQNIVGTRDGVFAAWNPVWAPDSKRFAFLSSRGGDGSVRAFIFDCGRRAIHQISARALDIDADLLEQNGSSATFRFPSPVLWLDDHHVLLAVMAKGERTAQSHEGMGELADIEKAWAATRSGRVPSVNVSESGRELGVDPRQAGELILVDVDGGDEKSVLRANVDKLVLSPDHSQALVIADTSNWLPSENRRLDFMSWAQELTAGWGFRQFMHHQLGLLNLATSTTRWLQLAPDPSPSSILPSWIAGGSAFVSLSKNHDDEGRSIVEIVDSAESKVRLKLSMGRLINCAVVGPRLVLVQDVNRTDDAGEPISNSSRWYAIDYKARVARTLSWVGLPPSSCGDIVPLARSSMFLVLRDARLTILDAANNRSTALTIADGLRPRVLLSVESRRNAVYFAVIGTIGTQSRLEFCSLRSLTPICKFGAVMPIGRTVLATDDSRSVVVIQDRTESGTFVSLLGGAPDSRYIANQHVAQISDPQTRSVDYRGLSGSSDQALIVLPTNYVPGRRYPMIVWVYPGQHYPGQNHPGQSPVFDGDHGGLHLAKDSDWFLNLNVLAAHGYAVLFPSMKVDGNDRAVDPMLALADSVVPAVNAAIATGIVDDRRIGVLGHSYGAFAVYGLISETNIFRAAVAINGPSNLFTRYTDMNEGRYVDLPRYGKLHTNAEFEEGAWKMVLGIHPWADLQRYQRNSPINYLQNVHTPLLTVATDLDGFDMGQAESVFMGLYRLNKPAQLAEYWGERHTLESPANISDLWTRIFAWFDKYLTANQEDVGRRH